MPLSEDEIQRYSRHIRLKGIGLSGQLKLKEAKVLVIGAGGLGCAALLYLTAAGIGEIGIVDYDLVELSNLHRQVLFTEKDIGVNKAKAAARHLEQHNSLIRFPVYPEKLSSYNAVELFTPYDVILDCSDNFPTRYLVNDVCVLLNKPWVYAALQQYEGQWALFNHQESAATYRCLFPHWPEPNSIPSCSEAGVIGALPGLLGTFQAAEAIKWICTLDESSFGRLHVLNLLSMQIQNIQLYRSTSTQNGVPTSTEELRKINYELI